MGLCTESFCYSRDTGQNFTRFWGLDGNFMWISWCFYAGVCRITCWSTWGVIRLWVNNCSQVVQEKELFVLFKQLFCNFEITSEEKRWKFKKVIKHLLRVRPLFSVVVKSEALQNVYTCYGILFSFEKEGHLDTCYNMDKPWGHGAKWNKPATEGQILSDSTPMRFLESSSSSAESRTEVARGRGERQSGGSI